MSNNPFTSQQIEYMLEFQATIARETRMTCTKCLTGKRTGVLWGEHSVPYCGCCGEVFKGTVPGRGYLLTTEGEYV